MSGSITGAGLDAVAARLSAQSAATRVELQAALHVVAGHLIEAARVNAREKLPKKGGLNERIATDPMEVRDRSGVIAAGVRIGTTTSDTRGTNRGRIRHPVFGHRDRWVEQTYEPGKDWFDDAMIAGGPMIEAAIVGVLEAAALRVTGV